MSNTKIAIVHPAFGVYLGNALGLGFWSALDPVGQPAAVVFDNMQDAHDHIAQWHNGNDFLPNVSYRPVMADSDCGRYASEAACRAAGLPGWVFATQECAGGVQ